MALEVTGEAGTVPARYQPPVQGARAPVMVWLTPDRDVLREAEWGSYL